MDSQNELREFDQENSVRLLTTVLNVVREDDFKLFPQLLCSLLDTTDPKKVVQLIRCGFELKLEKMRAEHQDLVQKLVDEETKGKISESERLIRVSNSDGKIRSMQWFYSALSS